MSSISRACMVASLRPEISLAEHCLQVTPGADASKKESPETVASYTLNLLKRCVPPAVPGQSAFRPQLHVPSHRSLPSAWTLPVTAALHREIWQYQRFMISSVSPYLRRKQAIYCKGHCHLPDG